MEEKQQLIQRFRKDQPGGFERVFKHFFPALLFFARRLVDHSGVAEEIVQDVLFRLWQKKKDFDSYEKVKAFLYISVRNACLDALTRERRKLARETTYADQQSVIAESYDEALIQAEFFLLIREAINRLPKMCRNVMLLLFEEGKSPKEIAQQLNVSISTVNNHKARGIDLLRKNLSKSQWRLLLLLLP